MIRLFVLWRLLSIKVKVGRMDIEELKAWVNKQDWVEAKTYKNTAPHQYLVKWKIPFKEHKYFIAFVKLIDKEGVYEQFYNTKFKYYHMGNKKYWSMDDTVEKTDLINRADVGRVYYANRKSRDKYYQTILEKSKD